ncbi:MAG: cyclic nucleotide-binding domain-containing protein [Thermincola sp.]|jgi:polyferredoxin/CRP-like cAMP-binding protein|nr:cyclic nucleotide-binding domain-containing protein [Thermincola sp.]MDT3703802.1 cyclic nucleotide-binding domain-containing protein [Thermincola sp.]
MLNDKAHYLSKVKLLAELNQDELAELAEGFEWETRPAGADIITLGQERNWFYVLVEGEAEVLATEEGRNAHQISIFRPGNSFGEISLFTGKPSPIAIRCTKDCTLLAMDAEHFAFMLVRWPHLYRGFAEKLSNLVNSVNQDLWESKHKEFLRSGLQLNQFKQKFYGLWGSAKTKREIDAALADFSKTGEHLLIIGERGTGRQMLAWQLHEKQFGEEAPFVIVDGRQIDQQWGDLMFEAQSFKGSGLLDLAEGGTLYIREINLVSQRAQLRLAQAIQAGDAQCRIIGSLLAEPELLPQRMEPELTECFPHSFKFTPLRERKRDIPVLALGLIKKLAAENNRPTPALSRDAVKLLLTHHYRQGNVTELIQVMERAFYLAEDNTIGLEHVFFGPPSEKIGRSIDLLSFPWVEKLIKETNFHLWLRRLSAIIFFMITFLMLFAPSAEITRFIYPAVWGLWWPALTIFSPSLGRVWCSMCPFAFTMSRIQKVFHLNRPVPDLLKKYDFIFITFLFLLVFWVEAMTGMRKSPPLTAIWLITIVSAAIITGIIYTRHTWCRHLCPLGGFVGMASVGGMLEVRADTEVCLNKCTTFECYRGTPGIAGCPMSQHLPYLDNNIACKLCLNCIRNCPNGSAKLNLRVPAREVWHLVRVNQGFVVFIGASLGMLLPIMYFEPLHNVWPLDKWRLWFSLAFWGATFLAGLITWHIVKPFQTKAASLKVKLAFSLIPLVLAGYIIYQLHFIPGIASVWLDLSYQPAGGGTMSFRIPALTGTRVFAIIFGLVLTGITATMVVLRAGRKKSSGK